MEELWLAAPCAALRIHGVGAGGAPRWRLNNQAHEWAARHAVSDADWAALAVRQSALAGSTASVAESVGVRQAKLRCTRLAMAEGWLVWLRDEESAGHGVLSVPLAQQLALAQHFGRLGLWERDLRTGMGRWDHTMFELFGFDPAGPVPSFEAGLAHVHPDDRERLAAHHRDVRRATERESSVQFRVMRSDGSCCHLQSLAELRAGSDGRPELMIGAMIDVTVTVERMQAQQRTVDYLGRALDLANVGIWQLDLATMRLHLNARCCRELGLPEAPGGFGVEEFRSHLHPDDRAGIEAAMREAASTDTVVDFIARFKVDGEAYRTLLTRRVANRDADGRTTTLAGVALDITTLETERVRAASLRDRLLQLSDAFGFGLWSREALTQRIEWDAQMYRLYGRAPEAGPPSMQEFFGRYVHPLDVDALLATQNRADQEWTPEVNTEFRVQTPDGVRWIASWTRREVRDGRQVAFGAHVDITERRNAAAARRDKERVEQDSRAQAEFVAHLSHELRTPLNAVLGFAQLLDDDGTDPLSPTQRERLRPLLAAAGHLRSLVDDTLDLTRAEADRQSLQIEPVHLADVCAEAVGMARSLAERHAVTLRVPPAGAADGVLADRRRLMQVVTNLLTNGIKYNRSGGWVQLDIEQRQLEGQREVALVVRDNGHGLTAQQLASLFEPFNRLGAERKGIEGSGIGLTIVRRFIERMGGSVDVVSTPGQGSEFRVWLPAGPPASSRADRSTAAPSTIAVLCIEDNEVNVLLMREMFSMRPEIELHCVPDGSSGIASALAQPPEVILLDLHLPDMHGVQVLQRLRQEPSMKRVKIIALSANAMPADVRSALAAGFDDYWTKPIDFVRFLAGIDEIVTHIRTHRGGR